MRPRRGVVWALWKALIVFAGLACTNPHDAEPFHHVIDDMLADHAVH